MKASFPVALLGIAMVLAGCVSTSTQPLGPDRVLGLLGDPLVLDHDHADPALHRFVTDNVHVTARLAWDPQLLDRYPLQQYGELDVEGNVAYVAALWSGFALVDISDPAAPRTLSYTPIAPAYVADIKAADGGDLVLLGLQGSVAGMTKALTGHSLPVALPPTPVRPGTVGLQAWDATDRANPRLAGHVAVEGGCHMLSVLEQGGAEYVYCAPNDNTVRIFQITRQGPAVVFEPVAVWAPGDLSEVVDYKANPVRAQFTHDMTVQHDPLTGDPVMYVSFWDRGVWVVDVKEPANPEVLGVWDGKDAMLWGGRIHTSMATLIDGKRILVAIPEYADIPAVFVLDATDYGALRLLAEWQAHPDGDYGEDPKLFSTHNFQLVGSKVYMAMYHGGVWVLDLAEPTQPRAVAYYLPHEEPGVGQGAVGSGGIPDTWDVVVANGYVFALDIPTGLHVLHLVGDPIDEAYDSFA